MHPIDWIIANKEWLFSGAGLSAIVGLGSLLLWLSRRHARAGHKANQPPPEVPRPPPEVSRPPAQIIKPPSITQSAPVRADKPRSSVTSESKGDDPVSYTYQRVRIQLGDFHEFVLDESSAFGRKSRITHKQIEHAKQGLVARLEFALESLSAACIGDAEQVGSKEFLLPVSEYLDHSGSAVITCRTTERLFAFFKCSVRHINEHTGEIEVEIAHADAFIAKKA